MANERKLDALKSVSIKRGDTVNSTYGMQRVTGPTWDPSVGADRKAQEIADALEAHKAMQQAKQDVDPVNLRLCQLEAKVEALMNVVNTFVGGTVVDG